MLCMARFCSLATQMSRIFAISDLHVDIPGNRRWVEGLTSSQYQNDVIIVAGDVTDNMDLLGKTLECFKGKFRDVCYVPGNHELWLRTKKGSTSPYKNTFEKFHIIIALCHSLEVHTKPLRVDCSNNRPVWIVPLYSWYTQPDEDPDDTLFMPRDSEDVKFTQNAWMDNHFCVWPDNLQGTKSTYFADLNEENLSKQYDAPVISFSHFVPRFDLIPASEKDLQRVADERKTLGLDALDNPKAQGSNIKFNFTRYAGCKQIETQIRRLNSVVHVFGHQHRNRDRVLDNVRYVSHCLGYPAERDKGFMWGLSQHKGPKQIWP